MVGMKNREFWGGDKKRGKTSNLILLGNKNKRRILATTESLDKNLTHKVSTFWAADPLD